MKVGRRMDTSESRRFWKHVERAAAIVASWPAWKQAGITVVERPPRCSFCKAEGYGEHTAECIYDPCPHWKGLPCGDCGAPK